MITERDTRRIIRFLESASEAADPFARPVLRSIADLIDADLVEYFELRAIDRVGLAYATSRDQGVSPGTLEAFMAYRHQNPLGAFRWQPGHGALRLSSIVPARDLRRLEFHREYLKPMRIRDQIKIWLTRSPESAVCVSLDRSDGAFSTRDTAILEVLQPHLRALHEAEPTRARAERRSAAELTRREAQVLTVAMWGRTNREIAEVLVISPATVRKHLEHAYAKLGVRNRGEAYSRLTGIGPQH
ncbi:MAG: helix-turn-helix transcriptional regulator [Chloroflexota bacterium]